MKKLLAVLMCALLMATFSAIVFAEDTDPVLFNEFSDQTVGNLPEGGSVSNPDPSAATITFAQSSVLNKVVAKVTLGSSGYACIDIRSKDGSLCNATGKDMLEFWVDFSEMDDSAFAVRLWSYPLVDGWQYACFDLSTYQESYYYQDEEGDWIAATDPYGRVALPAGYVGKVRIDLNELLISPCPYEGNGQDGDISKIYQFRVYCGIAANTAGDSFYVTDIRFVDSSLDEEPSSYPSDSSSDPGETSSEPDETSSEPEETSSEPTGSNDEDDDNAETGDVNIFSIVLLGAVFGTTTVTLIVKRKREEA